MLQKLIFILLFCFQLQVAAYSQEALCTKGFSYGEMVSTLQIKPYDKLVAALQQKCFEVHSIGIRYASYERRYDKEDGNTTTSYNEFFYIKNGVADQYVCSDAGVCDKLMLQISDNAIFRFQSEADSNRYIYLLKDKLHVIEMEDIPDPGIGYAYGFRYRAATPADLSELQYARQHDDFAKTMLEKAKLTYRYARVYSYENATSIQLSPGDKVYLEAGGEITFGSWAGSGGPDGIEGFTSYNRVQNVKHGTLLYRIGQADEWLAAGSEKVFVADKTGNLQLTANDEDPSNNSGFFWINVSIIRSK